MPRNIKILLADDDKDDCLIFKEALEELPISSNFIAVNDGQQLMQLLAKNADEFPNILFLDLNMPRKNGIECLIEIKGDLRLKNLPVVIISTSLDERIADKLYREGAHYYIRKPADFSQLKNIILQVLTLTEKQNTPQPARENFLIGNQKSIYF